MYLIFEKFGILPGWLIFAISIFLRYAIFAGMTFWFFYILKKQAYSSRKIQQKYPKTARILQEIGDSAITAMVFACIGVGLYWIKSMGFTRIYTDVHQFGWVYLLFSFFLLTIIHDTYFYWIHRLMHHPRWFKVLHRVHHKSTNPTPWASLAFHPLEAIVEIGIVPLAVFIIPVHPIAMLLFATWSLIWNVVGHLGFELFPQGFVHHPIFRWFNTSTHHNMHHQKSNCNYGLYYNFWDTVMGTNHQAYRTKHPRGRPPRG